MQSLPKVKYLILRYNNTINHYKLPFFRAAIFEALEDEFHFLFHNDEEEKSPYTYPLIQCKRIHGKAALVCINEGIEAITSLTMNDNFTASIGSSEEDGVNSSQS